MSENSSSCPWRRLSRSCEILRPPLPQRSAQFYPGEGVLVVLLHGLWRSEAAMAPLARSLARAGHQVLNIPYASFRWELGQIMDFLQHEIEPYAQGKPVHFVTHSLGGILARHWYEHSAARAGSRLLMLAPPNQGSAIIENLDRGPLLRILGPMGKALHPKRLLADLPNRAPEGVMTRILAGTRPRIPFFQRQLKGANDGIVTVAETHLPGSTSELIATDHTFITAHPQVMRAAADFLAE